MQYVGRLRTASGDMVQVHLQLNGERISLRSGSTFFGSWEIDEIDVERLSLFRFRLTMEGEDFILVPDDPTGFAEATDASIDLRDRPRFGLSARLNQEPYASAR